MPGKVTEDRPRSSRHDRCGLRVGKSLADDDERTSTADHPGIRRLYTPAMIADVLGVPSAAVRHWIRGGLLEPARRSRTLVWLDYPQLVVGRGLARLLAGGLSLREIDAKLSGLVPGGAAAAARATERIVTDGRRLSIRRGDRLVGAFGQLQFEFYTERLETTVPQDSSGVVELAGDRWTDLAVATAERSAGSVDVAEILDLADDLEAAGEFGEAAEALRALLQAQGPSAQVMFMLAEMLYRSGDLAAARERYYATIEIDAEHLQARTSLGCVLAELEEHDLALAALEGVLRQEPEYADAHWHVASVLAGMGRQAEARHHLGIFLELAPQSPWATLARERLEPPR